jgi:hypothetical protein
MALSNQIVGGGKNVYGARLGCLMLESSFPRIPGDMGNAETWPFPMLYRVVRGASAQRVVRERAEGLLDAFCAAADELITDGVDGITTTCGFLALFQQPLAEHCRVPVATSSLMQVPVVQALLPPGKRVGVITYSADALTPEHLIAAGAPPDTPVAGVDEGRAFYRVVMESEATMDLGDMLADVLDAGEALAAANPDLGAVVVECANMPPYSRLLRDRLGLPVFDLYTFITWFHASLSPRDFGVRVS